MQSKSKHSMGVIEQAVCAVLFPLGFKKQKATWRRQLDEVLHQFTIFNMQLADKYRPEWGLNLLNRCEDPKPPVWKLHVRWTFETMVEDLNERLRYFDCLKLDSEMADSKRQQLTTSLVTKYVVPCFNNFTTEVSVRTMMKTPKYPLRAQMFVGLPESWWPDD